MSAPPASSRLRFLPPLAIIGLAAFLRLHRLDLMEYKYDQVIAVMMARDIVDGRRFHLQGLVSSVGLENPGLFIWIMAVAVAVRDSPLMAAGAIAVLNAAALGWFYFHFRRRWPEPVVLAAMLLLATSPWAAIFSRCIWAQDLLPVFMIPFAWCLLMYLDEGRPRHGMAAVILLGLAAQIHMSVGFFLPGVLILLAARRRLLRRELWIGAGVVLLTLVPYFVYLARHADRTRELLRMGRAAAKHGDILGLMRYGVLLSGGIGLPEYSLRGSAATLSARSPVIYNAMQAAGAAVIVLAVIGLGAALAWRLADPLGRDLRRAALMIAVLWLGYAIAAVPSYPHYAIILYPWPFVFAAAGAWTITNWIRGKLARTAIMLSLPGLVAAANTVFLLVFLAFVGRHDLDGTEYGQPYRDIPTSFIARILAVEGRPDRAIEQCDRGLRTQPDDVELLSDQAWYTAQAGDPRRAVALLNRTLSDHPRAVAPARRLAALLATDPAVRDPARALVLAREVVRHPPCLPEDYFNVALALDAVGRREEAIVALRQLVFSPQLPARDPDRPRFEKTLREWTKGS